MATSNYSSNVRSISYSDAEQNGYTFVDPLPKKYICGICNTLLREPHVTECCGQHFCEDCLKKSASQNTIQQQNDSLGLTEDRFLGPQTSDCPHCGQNNFHHIRYLLFKREIDSMKVHCLQRPIGCNMQVAYSNREDHNKICRYTQVFCTNECGKTIFKKYLSFHIQNECMLRTATCKSCDKIGTYKEIESFQHHFICPGVILKCPNSCGAQIERKAAKSHDLVCPEATVDCQFAEAGCEIKPKRKDLESHSDANMKQHLSQLMTAHVNIKQEFQAFKESHGKKNQPATPAPSQKRSTGWPFK